MFSSRKLIYFVFVIVFCAFALPKERSSSAVDIGKELFFDTILSKDQTIACASCHQPQFAFADSTAFSLGVADSLGTRNTPSIMNMAFRPYFFYDGRAATLEEQILVPIESSIEMHLPIQEAVARIQDSEYYAPLFEEAFATKSDSANLLFAIAEFIRSLESDGSAPHDMWLNGIDDDALSDSQLRGRDIFINKGKCFDCHFGPDFTGDEFRNIGLFDGEKLNDKGRFEISRDSADLGKFKVPGLRNIEFTAPYMHNGMFATLEEVVEYYDNPDEFVNNSINRDSLLQKPLGLTDLEKEDLVNFLHSLSDPILPYTD